MRFFQVLLCCLFLPNVFSQDTPPGAPAAPQAPVVEREQKEFNFFPGGKIEISNPSNGSVKIIGWKKGSVRVESERIHYYPRQEQSAQDVQGTSQSQTPVRIQYTQTSSVIRTSVPPGSNMEINLTIYVPGEKTDIKAKINKGDFSVDGVNGWIEVTVVSEGGIEAKSLAGYFSGTTPRGDIDVEMNDVRWRGLEFAAMTQQGSVNLRLPVKYSAALQLETKDGKLLVDYPPQVVEGEETRPQIVIRKNAQYLKASVGDGGAPIKLATNSGDVKLLKKE